MKEKNTNKTWIIAIVKHFSPLNTLQWFYMRNLQRKKLKPCTILNSKKAKTNNISIIKPYEQWKTLPFVKNMQVRTTTRTTKSFWIFLLKKKKKNKTIGTTFIMLRMGLHIPYGVVKVYDHMKDYAKSSLYDLQENLLLKFHVDGWELRK